MLSCENFPRPKVTCICLLTVTMAKQADFHRNAFLTLFAIRIQLTNEDDERTNYPVFALVRTDATLIQTARIPLPNQSD